jgi:hypothetical protein
MVDVEEENEKRTKFVQKAPSNTTWNDSVVPVSNPDMGNFYKTLKIATDKILDKTKVGNVEIESKWEGWWDQKKYIYIKDTSSYGNNTIKMEENEAKDLIGKTGFRIDDLNKRSKRERDRENYGTSNFVNDSDDNDP